MSISARLVFATVLVVSQTILQADIAADYGSITGTSAGLSVSGWGTPGTIARHGKAAFPILLDSSNTALMAAGRYNDSYASTAACAVVFSHNGSLNGGGDSMPLLLEGAVKWASRKTTPSTITVGCGSGITASFWTSRGYLTKTVSTTMSSSTDDLSGVDVFVFDWHSGYSAAAITKIQTFTAGGGGIVCGATPWALGATPTTDAFNVLTPFGLTYGGGYWSGASPATVSATAPSPYYSALNGSGDLVKDKEGLITMTLANKIIAANSIDQVLAVRTDITALNTDMETLSNATHYSWITPTNANPVSKSTQPVEAMLARYQSNKFDNMTPAQLFVHPCASDFPGTPSAGSTVSKTVSVNGTTPVDFYMNQGYKPTRVETGVYAAPGATITITIPAGMTSAGLQAHIAGNGSEDLTWNIDGWTYFPKLWRRVPLTATTTQTGNVFGGLVTILVPAGSSLGTFNVTVTGALEAPCFVLGTNTDTEWNTGLSTKPAPYGYVKTDKLTLYVPKSQLSAMTNPTAVATHWKTVMDTADEYYGYTPWRKRSEAIATSRYVAAGAAYAGYPIEAGWGTDSAEQLNDARVNGSWGNYHELGHGFQDNFDGAFVIPTHAEADVNLFPGMIFNMVHKHTAWDNNSHPSLDASERIIRRADYFALPAAQQTWQVACEGDPVNDKGEVVYHFYYNISEAFGWTAYKTAFTRLMNYLQNPTGSTDTDLKNLSTSDPNFKRNRFYILFCDATGRNLDTYFQRYGLGKVGGGYEITASVKTLISSRGYPVWSDNQLMTGISNPGTVTLPESTAAGTVVHAFSVTDPDPGETHTFVITAGDPNGDFTIDRGTGVLSVRALDYERATSYSLTVTAYGDGIPLSGTRDAITRTFTVNVTNTVEVPAMSPVNFEARASMAANTVLGTVSAVPETGRTITGFAIVAGNGSGVFAINSTTGVVTVVTPASLPNPGTAVLTVRVTDSAGQFGYGRVQVFCNTPTVLADQQWKLDETSGTTAANGAGGLTGTYEGAPTLGQAGARADTGNSMAFDGVNDDVKVLPLGLTSNTFTITGWIKRNGSQTPWSGLVYSRAAGTNAGSGIMVGDNNDLRYSWGENYWWYYSGLMIPDNQWCFVALVVEPTKATLYLHDGTTLRSAVHTAAQTSTPLDGNFYLGYDPTSSTRRFKGNMDDSRMYVRSLSAAEIQQCYDNIATPLTGSAGTAPTVSLTAPTNGASLAAPVSTAMTASVTDNFSNIAKVQFYDGASLVGEDATTPYSVTWATSTGGSHALKARVTYDGGATVDSSVNTVTVTASLPSGWTGSDIGSVAAAGGSSYSSGVYTVTGSGADIWGAADGVLLRLHQFDRRRGNPRARHVPNESRSRRPGWRDDS
ncbi:MAG: M60 family metallopeptidase [Luteolibacter sp.]